MLGGGGYTIRNVARCWTYETAVALDCSIPNELPYNDYFEYFGPDFKLHISPSNMTNQNTNEYLEKIKQRLFENLRMLPHAPGVQMQAIPEDAPHPDSGDEDEEDPDKHVSSKTAGFCFFSCFKWEPRVRLRSIFTVEGLILRFSPGPRQEDSVR